MSDEPLSASYLNLPIEIVRFAHGCAKSSASKAIPGFFASRLRGSGQPRRYASARRRSFPQQVDRICVSDRVYGTSPPISLASG